MTMVWTQQTVSIGIVIGLFALASVRPAAAGSEEELADLQMLLQALDRASSETKLMLLAAGFGDIARKHQWQGTCADAFLAYGNVSREARRAEIEAAFPGCSAMCPAGPSRGMTIVQMGMLLPVGDTEILVGGCDAEGPEPVFDGDLAPLRKYMSTEGYWVFRAAFDLLGQRLDAIGGEPAEQIRAEFEALIPWVAAELSPAPPSKLTAVATQEPPADALVDGPAQPLTVRVTTEGFQVRVGSVPYPADEGALRRAGDGGDYPFDALNGLMVLIKDENPDEDTVTVEASDGISHGVLIATLAACQERPGGNGGGSEQLFPIVVISVGPDDPVR